MANYISKYTGEQIDAGIDKAYKAAHIEKNIIPSANYAAGATVTFTDNPANYDYFFGRIAYVGTTISALTGVSGSRTITLASVSYGSNGVIAHVVELSEQEADDNNWVITAIKRVDITASGSSTSDVESVQININGVK